jgi:hypothetical protein
MATLVFSVSLLAPSSPEEFIAAVVRGADIHAFFLLALRCVISPVCPKIAGETVSMAGPRLPASSFWT